MAAAVAGVAVYQLAFFAAVDDTGVAVGTIVALGSAPTLTGLFEWILERRRPPAAGSPRPRSPAPASRCSRWRAATPTCRRSASRSPSSPAARTRSYTLAAKRLIAHGHAPESVMAVAFGLGALVLLPALLLSGPGWLGHPGGLALALFLGIVPTALAYVLFASGLRRLSASETATLTLAEPLTAGVLGAVVLAEPMGGGRGRRCAASYSAACSCSPSACRPRASRRPEGAAA